MSEIQSQEIISLRDLSVTTVQSIVHTPMATHPPLSSKTTSSIHDAYIQSESNPAGDTSPPSSFHQWKMYPENLSDYDILDVDINQCHRKLNKSIESDMLVGDPTKVETLTMPCTNGPGSSGLDRFSVSFGGGY